MDKLLRPYHEYEEYNIDEMDKRSMNYYNLMKRRRSVRDFSSRNVPEDIIRTCVLTAGTAPSGANLQPWHFVIVSDKELKREIRKAAEKEENEFYSHRAPGEWKEKLKPLGTNSSKPFLESAPYLIAIFEKKYDVLENGKKEKFYYSKESVGIACGILISAIHNAGLVSLTHTPSPMNFLNKLLKRPETEKPFLLLIVGYPAENVNIPDIKKFSLEEIATFY